jgi:hypothetical protein
MPQRFAAFFRALPAGRGYCVDCLSQVYGEPVAAVGAYLVHLGLVGQAGQCRNCDGTGRPVFLTPSS